MLNNICVCPCPRPRPCPCPHASVHFPPTQAKWRSWFLWLYGWLYRPALSVAVVPVRTSYKTLDLLPPMLVSLLGDQWWQSSHKWSRRPLLAAISCPGPYIVAKFGYHCSPTQHVWYSVCLWHSQPACTLYSYCFLQKFHNCMIMYKIQVTKCIQVCSHVVGLPQNYRKQLKYFLFLASIYIAAHLETRSCWRDLSLLIGCIDLAVRRVSLHC